MATYAVGDLQGCLDEFRRLLDEVAFDPAADRVWLVGDLVNRGPDSLGTLRYIRALGTAAECVLGNHDLHLVVVGLSARHGPKRKDTFHDILAAPDRDELLAWLRAQPLLRHDPALNAVLVHAGLPPGWDVATASAAARRAEALLTGPAGSAFLSRLYGNHPDRPAPDLSAEDDARYTINALTRMRYVHNNGRLDFAHKGALGKGNDGLLPWFDHPRFINRQRPDDKVRIVFGHWSTLSLAPERSEALAIWPLDTGAVWGGELTALRLDDGQRFAVKSRVAVPLGD